MSLCRPCVRASEYRDVTISSPTGGQGHETPFQIPQQKRNKTKQKQKGAFSHFSTRSSRTHGPTDRWTDKASYRIASSRLTTGLLRVETDPDTADAILKVSRESFGRAIVLVVHIECFQENGTIEIVYTKNTHSDMKTATAICPCKRGQRNKNPLHMLHYF